MKILKQLILFIALFCNFLLAQTDNVRVGSDLKSFYNNQGAFYDYSDPTAINIQVSIWGSVKFPGRYVIPNYSEIRDLLSYAGGPTENAKLEDLRLYRVKPDSTEEMIKLNYEDVLWGEKLISGNRNVPKIIAGDVLVIPTEPKLFFSQYFSMTLSVVSTLISLSILILNIVRK